MDLLTSFLENSSIHGLGFISHTKSFRRAFWVCVVISGFTAAGIIINESFQNWANNPVITTVETMSIEDITFPKVTVCPPPNTYTNLNYDLITVGNKTMFDNVRYGNQTYDAAVALSMALFSDITREILENEYNQTLKLYFEEENKYRNWYSGFSQEDNNPLKVFDIMEQNQMQKIKKEDPH